MEGIGKALWLASIFGPFMAITGFWMVVFGENFSKMISSMKSTPGAFFLSAVINMIVGLAVITQFNVWVWDTAILVTIFGWAMFLRGVCVLFIPQLVLKYTMADHGNFKLVRALPLIWGLVLSWFAFLS
jgi:hypothetical protein